MSDAPLLVYNLFPPIAGHVSTWTDILDRAQRMGFNAIYTNPLYYPGFSGSLYAVKDYYAYNPNFFSSTDAAIAEKELRAFAHECKSRGLRLLLDLVINHTASDSALVSSHPEWYKRGDDGKILSPGAWQDGEWISWGDLAEIDNKIKKTNDGDSPTETPDVWKYWYALVDHSLDLGFSGFRCDAAYQVPVELWKELIARTKASKPDAVFFAETLGCPLEDTVALAEAGFDYVASSSRWWDFKSDWLPGQYEATRVAAPSVGFPETHDTERAITEYRGNIDEVLQRLEFTALFTRGWMITEGFEHGYRNRCDVVTYIAGTKERIQYDLESVIRSVIETKLAHSIFYEEGEIDVLSLEEDDEELGVDESLTEEEELDAETPPAFFAMIKYNKAKTEGALFLCNLEEKEKIEVDLALYPPLAKDVSLRSRIPALDGVATLTLAPREQKVFLLRTPIED